MDFGFCEKSERRKRRKEKGEKSRRLYAKAVINFVVYFYEV